MNDFSGRTIVLGVGGGIAAYKACDLARLFVKGGGQVRVAMTSAAARFVGPLTFQALTGAPVLVDLLDPEADRAYGHLALARAADLLVIAPATADLLARLRAGMADDAVTTTALACQAPVLLAPAMNTRMWQNPAVRENVAALSRRGWHVVGPASGAARRRRRGRGTARRAPRDRGRGGAAARGARPRRPAGARHGRADPRAARPGAVPLEPLHRADGLRRGASGGAAGRGGGARQRPGRAPNPPGVRTVAGGHGGGDGAGGRRRGGRHRPLRRRGGGVGLQAAHRRADEEEEVGRGRGAHPDPHPGHPGRDGQALRRQARARPSWSGSRPRRRRSSRTPARSWPRSAATSSSRTRSAAPGWASRASATASRWSAPASGRTSRAARRRSPRRSSTGWCRCWRIAGRRTRPRRDQAARHARERRRKDERPLDAAPEALAGLDRELVGERQGQAPVTARQLPAELRREAEVSPPGRVGQGRLAALALAQDPEDGAHREALRLLERDRPRAGGAAAARARGARGSGSCRGARSRGASRRAPSRPRRGGRRRPAWRAGAVVVAAVAAAARPAAPRRRGRGPCAGRSAAPSTRGRCGGGGTRRPSCRARSSCGRRCRRRGAPGTRARTPARRRLRAARGRGTRPPVVAMVGARREVLADDDVGREGAVEELVRELEQERAGGAADSPSCASACAEKLRCARGPRRGPGPGPRGWRARRARARRRRAGVEVSFRSRAAEF